MSDFSCYINIKNESSVKLEDGTFNKSFGKYKSEPAKVIKPNENTKFRLSDKAGPAGSTGNTKYRIAKNSGIDFYYDCPYGSKNNILYPSVKGIDLEVEYYGNNKKGYLENIPNGYNHLVKRSGHPLSGIFIVKDCLSAGWDIISAMTIKLLNKKVKELYKNNKFPHKIDNIEISCPYFSEEKETLKINLELKGKEIVNLSGKYSFQINLDNLKATIKEEKEKYYIFLDFNKNIIEDINTPSLIIQKLIKKILKSIDSPIKIPLNLNIPLNINKNIIKFKFIQKNKKSFLAILIGLNGNEGRENISDKIINGSDDKSIILSNLLIMNSLKIIFDKILVKNKIFEGNEFLTVSKNTYPYELYNNKDSKATDKKCNATVKIDKYGLSSNFINYVKDSHLRILLHLRYTEVIIGVWHTFPIEILISFSEDNGKLKLTFDNNIGKCSGGTTCSIIKKNVKKIIEDFNKEFKGYYSFSNFKINYVDAPSFIQISGEEK